jgi:hypothetical protein
VSGGSGSGTAWVQIASTDIASAVTSYTFSGLSGDTDLEYQLVSRVVSGAASVDFSVLPNNDTTMAHYGETYGGGQSGGAFGGTEAHGLGLGNAYSVGDLSYGDAFLYAKSGQVRTMNSIFSQDVSGAAVSATVLLSSSWNNTASQITSLVVNADVASGLGVGTHLELWALRTVGSASLTGGVTNEVPLWTSSTAIGTSNIYQSSGNIGIGTAAPQAQLHVYAASGVVAEFQDGANLCTHTASSSSETVSCSSDMRLKKDIVDSGSGLSWLGNMRVRDFTIKSTGERRTGVIAQEMQVTHPDMVHMGSNSFYTVDEPNPWKFVKAIQELKALIDTDHDAIAKLQADNDNLRAANDNLRARLDKLEAASH